MFHSRGWTCMVAVLALAGSIAEAQQVSPLRVSPNALLVIDQNRATVVDRIVANWGDALAQSGAGLTPDQMREVLNGLRADHLLAASLAGTLTGLRDVMANALTTSAAVQPGRVQAKALGDSNDDLVYTPVVPCRIVDTRYGTVPPYNAQMVGGSAFPVAANLSNFASQGGSASNCGLPSSFQAVVVTFTVLNPNFDAFLAASNTSNFTTLTQSVVMDFSANRGLANTATVPVDGAVKFYLGMPAQLATHVIADVAGYFRPSNYGGTHTITGLYAADGGGKDNTSSGYYSTVAGGNTNTASNFDATVGGGVENTASGDSSTVGGGDTGIASGTGSTVVGGIGNTASGFGSTVVGGQFNVAGGSNSVAMGLNAHANHSGAFVFADSTFGPFSSTVPNQFMVAASGGIGLFTNKNYATYCVINAGTGTWSCSSSRTVKRDFEAVDAAAVLAKVATLPMSSWRYMNEAESIRHLGPFAEDFRSAFGLGVDDKSIATVDEGGVALAAIQGLNAKVDKGETALHKELQSKDAEIAALKDRLAQLEAAMANENTVLGELGELRRAVGVLMARTWLEGRVAQAR